MKKLLGYLPLHFLFYLILGICVQTYIGFWSFNKLWIFVFLLLLLFIFNHIKRTQLFIVTTWLAFCLLGTLITYHADSRNGNHYFEKHSKENSASIVIIEKIIKSNAFYDKYEGKVVEYDKKKVKGRVLINIQKDSSSAELKVDDQIYGLFEYLKLQPPLNPYQFDYQKYLARKNIHYQISIRKNEYLQLENKTSFLGSIANIRSSIQNSLSKQGFSEEELSVINALLLGQRVNISQELIDDYSRAGAIHILAVSGLHVGILLLILSFIFKPLEKIRGGKILKLLLIVLFLWLFALIAGMSASVVRAVTMFTAVAIGQSMKRNHSVEQSLILSMFVILICKPMFLFDVGFQMSYLAVFGIVWIQPKIYRLWKPRYTLMHKIWQLITVSVAAQLAVFPLSLFYFHQFPGLFLVSNLIIVPFLGAILIGGIVIIGLSVLSILPDSLTRFYGKVISLMNDFVAFVSRQDSFLFSDISFSYSKMMTCYGVIVLGISFFTKMRAKRLLLFLFSIVLFQLVFLFENYERDVQKEWIVFHKSRNSIYGERKGSKLYVSSFDSLNILNEKIVKPYIVEEGVELQSMKRKSNFMKFKTHQILIIDSLGVYDIENLISPIVLLSNSPKMNLEKLINEKKPSLIIADGSNYKSDVALWRRTCIKTKTPFWSTNQNGAYILR